MAGGPEIFQSLCLFWLTKLWQAREKKKELFQKDADEAFRFFSGPHDFMFQEMAEQAPQDFPVPSFMMTCNKVAEFVQLFGPSLYYENPQCQVVPRETLMLPPALYPDPMYFQFLVQAGDARRAIDVGKSLVLERYLDWVPRETNMLPHGKAVVDEALIKGRGVGWIELFQPPGTSFRTVGMFYDSVDLLQIDPDADSVSEASWIARECVHPVWEVEREYGLPPGTLRPNVSSHAAQAWAEVDPDGRHYKTQGMTNDLIRYYKIYSRMGLGGRLSGANPGPRRVLDLFGDHVFLVVAEGCPFPLNLPPSVYNASGAMGANPRVMQDIVRRLAWPTPFWQNNQWPCALLDFHPVPRSAWPMSHLRPGRGELRFLNWAYSFLAGKMRNTCRDFVAVLKSASSELKTAILTGRDLELIEIEAQGNRTINEVVQFLQHPQINGDIWKVIEAVERNFERRVGLTDLLYGSAPNKQIRVAGEVEERSANSSIRPDDMAQRVEAFMSQAFGMIASASRYHLRGQDVGPLLGPEGARFWDAQLASRSFAAVAREMEYRIAAGSTRKPNRARDAQRLTEAVQVFFPAFLNYGMQSLNFDPANALIAEWCRVNDMQDPERFFLVAPQPALPPPGVSSPPPGGPNQPSANGPPSRNGVPAPSAA